MGGCMSNENWSDIGWAFFILAALLMFVFIAIRRFWPKRYCPKCGSSRVLIGSSAITGEDGATLPTTDYDCLSCGMRNREYTGSSPA